MKRIYVLVEGFTERDFVSRILAPYFGEEGLLIAAIPMLKSGGGMGFSNLEHFKNNVKPLLYEAGEPLVTTMFDLYRFPVQSGNIAEENDLKKHVSNPDIDARLVGLESVLADVVQKIKPYSNFFPYIQKYEFEALLFSDATVFGIESEGIQKSVEAVLAEISSPEDINTTEAGHPSNRLKAIFSAHKKKYNKGADAVDLAELAGINVMLEKRPRFCGWINNLIATAKS